jgi:hypothetical protein
MHKTILKATIVALATTVIAAGAMAQETKRGTGGGQTKSGQTAGGTGTRTAQPTPRVATPTPVAQPAPKPTPVARTPVAQTPVVQTPVVQTPSNNWFGRGHNNTQGIDRTQATQAREIERGIRNGSLTAGEAAQLKGEQARIAELERKAKADGHVTRQEREQIRNAQRQAEQHIWEESHDRERSHTGRGRGWSRGWW